MKLHLVDGTYELFRSYFAVPSLRSPGGQEVGAIRGMLQTLLVLLLQRDVTHIACAFDHTIESFRNELFQGYKTSAGIPEELLTQFGPAEEAVRAKFGIGPASIPDYLALVGDQADGIPGIPGWGVKGASQLLQAYGHIETIPLDSTQWRVRPRSAETLATTLANRYADALLYKKLATLRSDVPLAETLDELRWSGVPVQQFTEFCTRLGFQRLANQPLKWAR